MSDGFYEKYLKVRFFYRGNWYFASSISISVEGIIHIEHCHELHGCIDPEHVEMIEIFADVKEGGNVL